MTMKSCRWLAAVLAALTIVCGGTCKLFSALPDTAVLVLSAGAILLAFTTVAVVVRFHRCPQCGKFIPITLRPNSCHYCDAQLN